MAKIYAPNKDYTGVSAGVVFNNGVAVTDDPHLLAWFAEHGYKVEEETVHADNKPKAKRQPRKRG